MPETNVDVVRAAMQLERDGRMFYLDVAARTRNSLVRQMFESLADDELDHMAWLKDLLPGVDTAATANRRLYGRLRHIFADVPETRIRELAESEDDRKALDAGISIETASADAYERWARDSEDSALRDLCTTIAGVERFHRQVLVNTLEYLDHTPDWFMQEELWNFEGA